ncbi:hypothetical protein niasHT_018213 [Heterodera trifolii]|uniref:CSN8/PSMD8/EIF3K domain-containing protein n=1 Tax=Heterodera trifolii TaxID=157864 RepID=A0ABD2KYR1_9BILA
MEEPKDRCAHLEGKELIIGESLSVEEYAELLLGFLVQKQPIKAKYCYTRAIEKFERNQQLMQIWEFGDPICKQNFDKALRICNTTTFSEALQPYVEELKRRLTSVQLFTMTNSYSSIGLSKFAQLVGLDESSGTVQELLQKCNWTVAEDGFISPVRNAGLMQAIESLNDAKFGTGFGIKFAERGVGGATESDSNFDNLKSLIDSTMFFDAMAVQ